MSRRKEHGFSFIEILIVMGIIGVLVGGVVVALQIWAEKGPKFETQNRVHKVKLLVDAWRKTYEMLPPSDITKIPDRAGGGKQPPAPDNPLNEGIESVYQALNWPGFKASEGFGDAELRNTDEDKLRKAINKHDDPVLYEIVDAWGNPLIYFENADYAKYEDSGISIIRGDEEGEGEEVEVFPWKRENGAFINPNGFQVFSLGPDFEPNTADDVVSWTTDN